MAQIYRDEITYEKAEALASELGPAKVIFGTGSMKTLAEKIRLATRPIEDATPEELMENVLRLTHKEAVQWIKKAQAIRDQHIQQGRCPHCGDKKHKTPKCPLKVQGDREITNEVIRCHHQATKGKK